MKRAVITTLKILVPLAILAWLAMRVQDQDPDTFRRFLLAPKDWGRLALALLVCLAAVMLTFARWGVLVRALHIPFPLGDALQLGFIGYLFNFISLGAVGGDLFKAFFVVRQQPQRRTEAISSIVVDRVVGLFTMLLLASLGFALLQSDRGLNQFRGAALACWFATALGMLFLAVFLAGWISLRPTARWLSGVRWISDTLVRLDLSLLLYRRHWPALILAIAMGVLSHSLQGFSIFLLASAQLPNTPTLEEHFVMWPIAGAVSSLPLAPAGVGTFELTLSYIYQTIPAAPQTEPDGLVVALSYRVLTIIVAAIGVVFFLPRRRAVLQAVHEADEQASQSVQPD